MRIGRRPKGPPSRLRKARGDRTLASVAREACIGVGYLSEIERGEKMPGADVARSIDLALNVKLGSTERWCRRMRAHMHAWATR